MYSKSEVLFTNELLQVMRNEMDPVADSVIQDLFSSEKAESVNQLMMALTTNSRSIPAGLPKIVSQYFEETAQLPTWADQKRMAMGADFFAKHTQPILSTLGCLSLPYCYAAADGAQVLYMSQRIRKNTRKRLAETAQFVLNVMDTRAFGLHGSGLRAIQKVRLMHAAIRFHVLRSGQWDDVWGSPVNQEDMAGTNLAFSYIVLEGLNKLGFRYSIQEAEDYLHLWNVIGYLLGVRPVLLPVNLKGAFWLDKRIAERHFRTSEAGVELTKSLLHCLDELSTSATRELTSAYMRFLLGNKIADLLEVPHNPIAESLLKPLKVANTLRSTVTNLRSSSFASDALLLAIQQENGKANFTIPPSLSSESY